MDRETLYRFFDGVSTPDEDRRIVGWVDRDPRNEKIFNAERNVFNTLLMMDGAGPQQITRPKKSGFPRWTKELMRTAAVFALALGVGYYIHARLERRMDAADTSISVPVGQQLRITLSDGTEVTLNGSSTIIYPAIFSPKERRVRLDGEAYFIVAHDEKHPFVVEAGQYDVQVLGTEFNVSAYGGDSAFVTSLIDGKVRITDRMNPTEPLVLAPNQEARPADGKLVAGPIPEHENFLWRDGLIAFRKATFSEMMKLFEKYYGVRIVYGTDRLPQGTFSGKIRISEGIGNAFWALQQSEPFGYEKDAGSMIITIK